MFIENFDKKWLIYKVLQEMKFQIIVINGCFENKRIAREWGTMKHKDGHGYCCGRKQ